MKSIRDNPSKRKNKKIGMLPKVINIILHIFYHLFTQTNSRVNQNPFTSYCVAREYDLDKLSNFLAGRNYVYKDYVIGCRCIREFNENFDLNDLGLYKFTV